MDWLEEQLEKMKIQSVRLAGSLFWTLSIGLILVLLTWIFTISLTVSWERLAVGDQGRLTTWSYLSWQAPAAELSQNQTLQWMETIRWGSLPIYLGLYCWVVSKFFVEKRIMQPLTVISDGVETIKSGDLGQPIFYHGKDEFQLLTDRFNEMRLQLKESQQQVQQLHLEQKKLNAAFSHDLRTPLTVIQNNAEMIETFYPNGKMTDELLAKSLSKIQSNVQRLNDFAETMKSIQKIDDFEVQIKREPLSKLVETIRDLLHTFDLDADAFHLTGNFSAGAYYDLYLIMEVLENLLTNAVRYKKQRVDVTLERQDPYLFLFVKDDGIGFTKEELTHATTPYFSKNKTEHFGLGLTIASSLTEKHGGVLRLANGAENGAIVSAVFYISNG